MLRETILLKNDSFTQSCDRKEEIIFLPGLNLVGGLWLGQGLCVSFNKKMSKNNRAKTGSENGTQRMVNHQEYLQHYLMFIVVLSV